MFGTGKLRIQLGQNNKKIEEQEIEIQKLKNELKIENERRLVLEQVLDLLPNTGTFIIEDIQNGIIGYSNKPGRDLVKKATHVQIQDGQTSIHQFHKKPEQSKGVLSKMNTGEKHSNTTLSIGKTVIKSSSHKFNINGKDYFLGLFEDGTIEKNEIETINFLKNNLETLLKIFLTYSTLGVNFKILLKDLEDARNGVLEQKELINGTLGKILEQFEKSNGLFNQITIANQDVATIFKSLSLLALNGQIEAARQGEQGRGFAVVAEETMKTSNLSENVMRDSIRIVKTGIEKTNQEIEGITENIKEIVENRTIEELVEKRVGESKHHLENLVKGIGELINIGGTLSSNFKNFYKEKLKGKEKARLILETTKIDHLLFIIKLNTALTMDNQKLQFPAHTSCDLGKTIYSKEFIENFGEDEDYKMLLICHENVHKITNELNEQIGKEKIISKNTLEACNIRIQDELMSQVNMVLHLIENLSKKLL